MVWPTLGSRTAEEQNRTEQRQPTAVSLLTRRRRAWRRHFAGSCCDDDVAVVSVAEPRQSPTSSTMNYVELVTSAGDAATYCDVRCRQQQQTAQ